MFKVSVERACRLGNFTRGGGTARLRPWTVKIAHAHSRHCHEASTVGFERIHVLLRRKAGMSSSNVSIGHIVWKVFKCACADAGSV